MPFSKKKYNVLKERKKSSSISAPSRTYTKKPNLNCKKCPHRPPKSLTPPSSSSSSNLSSTGLISKLPKKKNTKKLHKILSKQVVQPGEVQRSLKKFNVVMVKDNFIPETCGYYLHYDVSKPLPKDYDVSRPLSKDYFVKK